MTQKSFKKILVISPFATSTLVKKMPKNYYSLALPVIFTAKAALQFITTKFPHKEAFCLSEIDCKNCVDLSNAFKSEYQKFHPNRQLKINTFLQSEAPTLSISSILKGYKRGDIIFLPDTSYASAVLIIRIVNFLQTPVVFLGADSWGNWKNTEVGKLNANFPYIAYRITPLSLHLKGKRITNFARKYKALYQTHPNDASYLSYNAIASIISAINKYGYIYHNKNMKDLILSTYTIALQKNSNWFRLKNYAVYKITPGKEVYMSAVNLNGSIG